MQLNYNTLFVKEINNAIGQLKSVKLTTPTKEIDM